MLFCFPFPIDFNRSLWSRNLSSQGPDLVINLDQNDSKLMFFTKSPLETTVYSQMYDPDVERFI